MGDIHSGDQDFRNVLPPVNRGAFLRDPLEVIGHELHDKCDVVLPGCHMAPMASDLFMRWPADLVVDERRVEGEARPKPRGPEGEVDILVASGPVVPLISPADGVPVLDKNRIVDPPEPEIRVELIEPFRGRCLDEVLPVILEYGLPPVQQAVNRSACTEGGQDIDFQHVGEVVTELRPGEGPSRIPLGVPGHALNPIRLNPHPVVHEDHKTVSRMEGAEVVAPSYAGDPEAVEPWEYVQDGKWEARLKPMLEADEIGRAHV